MQFSLENNVKIIKKIYSSGLRYRGNMTNFDTILINNLFMLLVKNIQFYFSL